MYGSPTTIGWMFFNQSAVVLGNIVGGAIVMAASEHAMNNWKSRLPWERDHRQGTLLGHDVESTRKAREDSGRRNSRSGGTVPDMRAMGATMA
jgi:hypothetical protein